MVLGKLISSSDGSEAWELGFAECLEAQTLKAIVLANTLAMVEPEMTGMFGCLAGTMEMGLEGALDDTQGSK